MPRSERLYYTDAYAREFDALVVETLMHEGRPAVVLDRTAFYPTSGGQPFDTGTLGAIRVVDVVDRDDGAVVHVLDREIGAGTVKGVVDWERRFEHMQQHTGQHVLSAAFEKVLGARTLSFHLGTERSTIDLSRDLAAAEIARAEEAANRIVWEDRPVYVRFVSDEEAASLPLRKEPKRTGKLRIVEVEGYDLSACGGTHVPATGVIGLIAVSGWERFKGGTRLAFVCGARALRSHGRLRDVVTAATRLLSVSASDLAATVERLLAEQRESARELRRLRDEHAGYRAAEYRARAETIGGLRGVLSHEPGCDAATWKTLAAAIVSEPGLVAVLVGDGRPAPVVVGRSTDVAVDAGALIKALADEFGGRGGGRPELAQGGVTADAPAIVARARAWLGARS